MAAVLLVLVGAVLVVAGVALLSVPVALVVAGGGLVAAGLFVDLERGGADGSAD